MQPGRLTLVACILGSGIAFLDQTVVNVALPAMREDLDMGLSGQQWVVEAYLLTLGSLLLVGGALGDLIGRRKVFSAGLVGFGVTSLACALAPDEVTLVIARAVQGIAGALLVPTSLAIINSAFPEDERGAAIGAWTAWTGMAFVIGPLGGGLLIDQASWRWIFAINVPLVVLNLWLVKKAVPESGGGGRLRELDFLGAVLCAFGIGLAVYALIERPDLGLAIGLAGAVLFAAFLWRESRCERPMVPLRLFGTRNFAWGNLATFLVYGGLGASGFFLTIFLQQAAGYSAIAAGAALMPITIVMWLLSGRFGRLADRFGPRAFMAGGPLLGAVGLAWMATIDTHVEYWTELLPGVLIFGVGLAVTVAPLTMTVLGAAPEDLAGAASGTNNAVARVASLLAIAVVGAIVAAVYEGAGGGGTPLSGAGDASLDAYRAGMMASAALVALGGLVSLAGIENRARKGSGPLQTSSAH
jgi:EmrB/QacA subfamily drug resistance transporter